MAGTADPPAAATVKPAAKLAIPSETAQRDAEKQVKDILGDRISKAQSAADRVKLAGELQKTAADTTDAAAKFVLLRQARDLALNAADVDVAVAAEGEIEKAFVVDGTPIALDFWQRFNRLTLPAEQVPKLCRAILNAAAEAVAADHYDAARQLGRVATAWVRRSNARELNDRLASMQSNLARYEAEHKRTASQEVILAARPDDAEANLAVGRFRCFIKGDWVSGLPLLAKGSDAAARSIALKELAHPATPQQQVMLADAWWALADTENASYKAAIRLHAGQWYSVAAPGLNGLARLKADERAADYVKAHQADLVAGAGSDAAVDDQQFSSPLQILQSLPAGLFPKNAAGWNEQRRAAGNDALKERVVGHQATFIVTLMQVGRENPNFLIVGAQPEKAGQFTVRITTAFDRDHKEEWGSIRSGGTYNVTGRVWIARFDPGLDMFIYLEDCRVLAPGAKPPAPTGGGVVRAVYNGMDQVIAAVPVDLMPKTKDEWQDQEKSRSFSKEYFRRYSMKRFTVTITIQSIDADPQRPSLRSVPVPAGSTTLMIAMGFDPGTAAAAQLADLKAGQTCTVTGDCGGSGYGSGGLNITLHGCRIVDAKK